LNVNQTFLGFSANRLTLLANLCVAVRAIVILCAQFIYFRIIQIYKIVNLALVKLIVGVFTGQDFLLFCCNYQSGSVDFLSFSGNGSHAN